MWELGDGCLSTCLFESFVQMSLTNIILPLLTHSPTIPPKHTTTLTNKHDSEHTQYDSSIAYPGNVSYDSFVDVYAIINWVDCGPSFIPWLFKSMHFPSRNEISSFIEYWRYFWWSDDGESSQLHFTARLCADLSSPKLQSIHNIKHIQKNGTFSDFPVKLHLCAKFPFA